MWLAGRDIRRRRRPKLPKPSPGSQSATGEDNNKGGRYQPAGIPSSGIFCISPERVRWSFRTSTPVTFAPNGSPVTGYENRVKASSCSVETKEGAPSICSGWNISSPFCRKRRPRTETAPPKPSDISRTTLSSSSPTPCTGTPDPTCARRETFSSESAALIFPESGCSVLTSPLVTLSSRFRLNGSRSMATFSVFTPARSIPFAETRAFEKLPAYIIGAGLLSISTSGVSWSPSWSWRIRAVADSSSAGSTVKGASTMRSNTRRANSVFLDTPLSHGPVLQVGVDKVVEVAVEDAVHVGGLLAGAVVLDQLVRVKYVGSDLGPPLDVRLLPALRGDLLLAPLALQLEEAGPKNVHRDLAVLVLAPLVLALHYDAGWQVRYAYRRVGLVDVLPARSGGPVSVYLEVLLVDRDLYPVVYDRRYCDRCEARVSPRRGVERADPHQPVHTALGRKKPEGVL